MQLNLSLSYENINCVIERISYSTERLRQECPTRSAHTLTHTHSHIIGITKQFRRLGIPLIVNFKRAARLHDGCFPLSKKV